MSRVGSSPWSLGSLTARIPLFPPPSPGTPLVPASRTPARSCPASLRGLSDRELLARVKDLVSRERAVTLEILVHLIEVERRRLHLGLGYPSLFEYCTSAPRLLELRGEPANPLRPVYPGLPRSLRATRKERGQPELRVVGGLDPHEGEQGRSPDADPEQIPERGRGDRGGLQAAGLASGPGEAGVRGGRGAARERGSRIAVSIWRARIAVVRTHSGNVPDGHQQPTPLAVSTDGARELLRNSTDLGVRLLPLRE